MGSGTPSRPAPGTKAATQIGSHDPYWPRTPTRYGAAEAAMTMGTIAAPLLAGFSLSAFIVIFTIKPSDVRYRDIAALLLLLAAVLLVMAVQATFWARQYHVTPAQLQEWWPDATEGTSRLRMLRVHQEKHMLKFQTWSRLAGIVYNFGLLSLLASLTVFAIPPVKENAPARWVAVGVGAIAFIAELGWVIKSLLEDRRSRAIINATGSVVFLMYLWLVYLSSGRGA